ncbi:YhcH/YjgK/YiaL family protein [Cuneatibacter caecimuris]|uniref:YhcH/YjgK/YiaL family protein n=1 Tax=Cuneatibacter caecimuris TaxID=1796618 RepID=A0A4Q7P279_9FIRM|nr:YhcH/YjgK/YiaL family protein [Cuneatibacter caecimuris]RZS92762.1 YhcH/YjgK/YiaL family protein [Cuneatibacter caecimuris]
MIYDKIENVKKYLGISPNLDKALNFIMRTDLNSLPEGRTEIDGDRVFLNIVRCEAKDAADDGFEYHKQYRDLQIDLEGTEIMRVATEWGTELKPYAGDIGFFRCEGAADCILGPGRFIVLESMELHEPCAPAPGCGKALKKAVFKIAAD